MTPDQNAAKTNDQATKDSEELLCLKIMTAIGEGLLHDECS
jgi:hypothetical protein